MANPAIIFLRRTYKVLIVIAAAVIFFLGYNTYLVDRSLVNLRFAVDRVNHLKDEEDVKKILALLDFSLQGEVAAKELSPAKIARLESAIDTLARPMDILVKREDVRFALTEAIKEREKERPGLLAFLDKFTHPFVRAQAETPRQKLEGEARALEGKINSLKDKTQLQEAYYELANMYARLKEFDKAKASFLKAIDLSPDTRLARKSRFNLAWNEKNQGNLDEAFKEFENFSKAASGEAAGDFGKYQMADCYRKKGEYDKAAKIFAELSSGMADTDLAQIAVMQEASVYLYDLKDYDKAKEVLQRAETSFKGSDMAKHMEKMRKSDIVAQYRREGFKALVEGYRTKAPEKFEGVKQYFDKALDIDPKDGSSYTGKALAYLWLNDPDRALDLARKAVNLMPNNEVASINLAYIYIKLNLAGEAVIELKRFIADNPLNALGYYNLGYAYAKSGRLEEAVAAFNQAVKIKPDFPQAYNNLGWCYWNLNQYNSSIEAFERATQIDPEFYEGFLNLGLVYKVVDRFEEAKKAFQMIPATSPYYLLEQGKLEEINKILKSK